MATGVGLSILLPALSAQAALWSAMLGRKKRALRLDLGLANGLLEVSTADDAPLQMQCEVEPARRPPVRSSCFAPSQPVRVASSLHQGSRPRMSKVLQLEHSSVPDVLRLHATLKAPRRGRVASRGAAAASHWLNALERAAISRLTVEALRRGNFCPTARGQATTGPATRIPVRHRAGRRGHAQGMTQRRRQRNLE